MTNKIFKRFSDISTGRNTDSSDEYYTLYHAFISCFLEILCRYNRGIKYKVIICPCDSSTSIFRELEKKAHMIGNPKIIYSHYPEKDWAEYFVMDYKKELGFEKEEVLIFTNPPFKGLGNQFEKIQCEYILFGSFTTAFPKGVFAKDPGGFKYIRNNDSFTGDADKFNLLYRAVRTIFFSNKEFISFGDQYIGKDKKECLLFGKDRIKQIRSIK